MGGIKIYVTEKCVEYKIECSAFFVGFLIGALISDKDLNSILDFLKGVL